MTRHFEFNQRKHDLIFPSGSGGNFITSILFQRIPNVERYIYGNAHSNEYEYDQRFTMESITEESADAILTAIRSRSYDCQMFIKQMREMNELRGSMVNFAETKVNSMELLRTIDEISNIIGYIINPENSEVLQDTDSVEYRKARASIKTIPISNYFIKKNLPPFDLIAEQEQFSAEEFYFNYSNIVDIFYQNISTDWGVQWEVGHIPFHLNAHFPEDVKVRNYSYSAVHTGDMALYTRALMTIKHALRDGIERGDYQARDTIATNKDGNYRMLSHLIRTETVQLDLSSPYCSVSLYRDLIVKNSDTAWRRLMNLWGFGYIHERNRELIHDTVHDYHESNLQLMREYFSNREIKDLMNPYG